MQNKTQWNPLIEKCLYIPDNIPELFEPDCDIINVKQNTLGVCAGSVRVRVPGGVPGSDERPRPAARRQLHGVHALGRAQPRQTDAGLVHRLPQLRGHQLCRWKG